MPSHLRFEHPLHTTTTTASHNSSIYSRPSSFSQARRQQKPTLVDNYILAHTARRKLSDEAQRSDHRLRQLVGHANMLDALMLDLHHAELARERRVNEASRSGRGSSSMRYTSAIPEEDLHNLDEADSDDSDSDSDSDSDVYSMLDVDTDVEQGRPVADAQISPADANCEQEAVDDAHMCMDEDHYNEDLALARTHSHSPFASSSPVPELISDSDESDDDTSTSPTSPPLPTIRDFATAPAFGHKQDASPKVQCRADALYDMQSPPDGVPIITAC